MYTYVIADIHGEFEKYRKMLELIEFSDEDTLYVLGDVVDRGPQPMAVLKDMMNRANVYPIYGNHDLLALEVLKKLSVEITEENYASGLDETTLFELQDWQENGGTVTIEDFCRLSRQERADILDYLSEFSLCEAVDTDENTFILVHAGLGNFRKEKKFSEYTVEELVMERNDPDVKYFDDDSVYIVTGHTPTLYFTGKAEIYKSHNNICIDCGACNPQGKLACLCLETMEEFYV